MPVIRSPWQTNQRYIDYLNSPQWKAKRKAVLERGNGICERCHKYLVDEVHHRTYAHVFNEPLEDLEGLCIPCHRFLHNKSGIDPLARSIHIKVTSKLIQYWDGEARKWHRISIATLPPECFRWGKMSGDGGKTWESYRLMNEEVGQYTVPVDVLFDKESKLVFQPSQWQEYKTATKRGRDWFGRGEKGRPIPPDPETVGREIIHQKQRSESEDQRMNDSPASYTSYQGRMAATTKEIMALFRKYRRIIDHGCEFTITSVRATTTLGVSLTLEREQPGWGSIRTWLREVDAKLATGEILLDEERKTWVVKDQEKKGSGV